MMCRMNDDPSKCCTGAFPPLDSLVLNDWKDAVSLKYCVYAAEVEIGGVKHPLSIVESGEEGVVVGALGEMRGLTLEWELAIVQTFVLDEVGNELTLPNIEQNAKHFAVSDLYGALVRMGVFVQTQSPQDLPDLPIVLEKLFDPGIRHEMVLHFRQRPTSAWNLMVVNPEEEVLDGRSVVALYVRHGANEISRVARER